MNDIKKRIVKREHYDGSIEYVIQKKILFWWIYCTEEHYYDFYDGPFTFNERVTCKTLDEARRKLTFLNSSQTIDTVVYYEDDEK